MRIVVIGFSFVLQNNKAMTTEYKGYKIVTKEGSHTAMIYFGNELIKCVAGDIYKDGTHNAIEKAKIYIDGK